MHIVACHRNPIPLALLTLCIAVVTSASSATNSQLTSEASAVPVALYGEATTPEPDDPTGALSNIVKVFFHEMKHSPYQAVNAFGAFAVGILLLFSGEFAFKWAIVGSVCFFTGIIAMNEVSGLWSLDDGSILRHIVGLEAAAIAGFCALKGYDAVMLITGAIVGFTCSYKTQEFLIHMGCAFLDADGETGSKPAIVVFYTLWIVGLMAVFGLGKHLKAVAIAFPAIGGAFVSSAVLYGATALALNPGMSKQVEKQGLTPVGGPWIDFLYLILSAHSPDVGVFAGSSFNFKVPKFGLVYADRFWTCALWFILFLIGVKVHCKQIGKRETQKVVEPQGNNASSNAKTPARAREPSPQDDLYQTLLVA